MPSVPLMGPGAMTLERTPFGPSSTAKTAESASTPALAAETWTWNGTPMVILKDEIGNWKSKKHTVVVKSRADMEVSTFRSTYMCKSCLDGVESTDLCGR